MTTVNIYPNYRVGWRTFPTQASTGLSEVADSNDATYLANWFATRETLTFPALSAVLPPKALPVSLQSYVRVSITELLRQAGPTLGSRAPVTLGIQLQRAEGGAVAGNTYDLGAGGWQDLYGPAVPWGPDWTDLANAPQLQLDAGSGALLFGDGTTEYAQHVSEVHCLLTYATQPVVSAVTPNSPQQATNRPPFSYVYAPGSDGGTQVARQVKVYFGLATPQFGVNNFNPDVAPAIWDSGVVYTNGTTGQIGIPLNNNANYTIFVKAAQSINGVLHWSEWAASTFLIQIPPALVPPKPSITAVVDNTLARVRLTVSAGGTPGWDHVTVQRSTDRKTWVPVRSAENQPAGGATFVVWDYESGNAEQVYYRAYALRTNTIGGVTFEATSPESNPAGPVAWTSNYTWLKSPTRPAFNRAVRFSTAPDEVFDITQAVWRVPGRSRPVVVSGVRNEARFPGCSFATLTAADSDDLLDLFMLSEPLLLQTPPAHHVGSVYVAVGNLQRKRLSRLIQHAPREFTADLTQVDRPAGPIVAVAWTWGDVLAKYPTWQSVKDNYATWADLIGATPKSAPPPVTPPTSAGNSMTDNLGNIITDDLGNEITD